MIVFIFHTIIIKISFIFMTLRNSKKLIIQVFENPFICSYELIQKQHVCSYRHRFSLFRRFRWNSFPSSSSRQCGDHSHSCDSCDPGGLGGVSLSLLPLQNGSSRKRVLHVPNVRRAGVLLGVQPAEHAVVTRQVAKRKQTVCFCYYNLFICIFVLHIE